VTLHMVENKEVLYIPYLSYLYLLGPKTLHTLITHYGTRVSTKRMVRKGLVLMEV
jgi:hypothetical protein